MNMLADRLTKATKTDANPSERRKRTIRSQALG
jgi:hypothetical protein